MSPSATSEAARTPAPVPAAHDGNSSGHGFDALGNPLESQLPPLRTGHKEPMVPTGALDQFDHFDVTPVIGREFRNVDLAEWLRAPNSDDLIRELAVTVSRRGVVFFRAQDNMNNDLQKELAQRMGELSGKPSTSRLHIHPVNNSEREHGVSGDPEISIISSEQNKKINHDRFLGYNKTQTQKNQWHSDITFEQVPSDYSLLRMTKLPKTGGDTLWASGCEVYDRISPPLQKFFDGLTAFYAQPGFQKQADAVGFKLWSGSRGAPENSGSVLEAVHPVVRTNPVTGWKSIFAIGHHVKYIHGLSDDESRNFLSWFVQLVTENHDLQVRLHWETPNDMAIWDNRSVYRKLKIYPNPCAHTYTQTHTDAATPDYVADGTLGERAGARTVSLGERPYFDPESTSRRTGLRAEGRHF